MNTLQLFETLIEKKAHLLSPTGSHWGLEIQYADGHAVVIFTNKSQYKCIDDETTEFLHYIGQDTIEIKGNHIKMSGSDGWGGDDELEGEIFVPFEI